MADAYWHFKRWRDDGTVDRLHDALRDHVGATRWPRPTAATARSVVDHDYEWLPATAEATAQVGHDRPDGPTARTRASTSTLAANYPPNSTISTPFS